MPPDNDVQKEIELLEQRFAENSQGLVFAHLADAYRRAGEYAKAEGLLLHGLKNHPSYTSAYNVLGRVYLDSQRLADAHEQFSKVLELDPQNLIALRALGDLAVEGGRLEEARSWYERMLQIDPRSKEAREGLERLETEASAMPASGPAEPAGEGEAEPLGTAEPESRLEVPSEQDGGAPAPEALEPETTGPSAEEALESSAALTGADETQEPWDIADMFPDVEEEESSPELRIEPVEGLIARGSETADVEEGATTGSGSAPDELESFAVSSELDSEDEAAPPDVIAGDRTEPSEPRPAETEGVDAEPSSFDLGEMEGWTPGVLGGAEGPQASGASGDVVADSIMEGLMGGFSLDLDSGDGGGESAGPEAEEAEERREGVVTETMAELYADQGLYEDALGVYRRLAESRPEDERIRDRIAELERRLSEARATEEGERELAELLELTQPSPAEATAAEAPPPVAELAEPLTEPGEPLSEPEEPRAQLMEPVAEPEEPAVETAARQPETPPLTEPVSGSMDGEFEFSDEAPVAGLEHLDPFAASFDVMAVRAEPPKAAEPAGAEAGRPEGPAPVEEGEPAVVEAEAEPEPVTTEELGPAEFGEAEPPAFEEWEPVAVEEPENAEAPEWEPVAFGEAEPAALEEAEPSVAEGPAYEAAASVEEAEVEHGEFAQDLGTSAETVDAEQTAPVEGVESADGIVYPVVEPHPVELEEDEGERVAADALAASAGAGVWEAGADLGASQADVEGEAVTVGDYLERLLAFAPEGGRAAGGASSEEPAAGLETSSSDSGPDDLEEFQEWLRSLKR